MIWLATLFDWAWRTSLQATILIVLVLLLTRFIKPLRYPRVAYGLGVLVMARLLLPVAPASAWNVMNLLAVRPQISSAADLSRIPEGEVVAIANFDASLYAAPVEEPGLEVMPRVHGHWMAWVWLVGCGVVLAVALLSHLRWTRNLRGTIPDPSQNLQNIADQVCRSLGISRPVKVRITGLISSPSLMGVRNPLLLIPPSAVEVLNEDEMKWVLRHELIHFRHRDVLWNWVVVLIHALHWFNPLVWVITRRWLADRELVRDAEVIAGRPAQQRRCYGETLLKLAETWGPQRGSTGSVAIFNQPSQLKRRINMIKYPKRLNRKAAFPLILAALGLASLTFTNAVPAGESEWNLEAKARSDLQDSPEEPFDDLAEPKPAAWATSELAEKGLQAIENKYREVSHHIESLQRQLAHREGRTELSEFDRETQSEIIRHLLIQRSEAETSLNQTQALLEQMQRLRAEHRIMAIYSLAPNRIVESLQEQLMNINLQLTAIIRERGKAHPEAIQMVEMRGELSEQLEEAVEDMMQGMQARILSKRNQLESLAERIDVLRHERKSMVHVEEAEHRTMTQELAHLHKIREGLRLRHLQDDVSRLSDETDPFQLHRDFQPDESAPSFTLFISERSPHYYLNDNPVTKGELADRLVRVGKSSRESALLIKAEHDSPFELMIQAMEIAKQARITNIKASIR